MGKDKSKKKAPFSNAEEAKAKIASLKEEIETAKEERKEFAKTNGLSMKSENFEANAAHAKHGKKWTAMTKVINDKRAEKETAEAWLKDNKPKKEKTPRETKYEYPEGMSDADKKKFRAKKRAEAKAAEKGEGKKKDKGGDKKKEVGKEGKSDKKKEAKPAEGGEKKKEKKAKKED